jgi:hypothetical protein
VAAVLDWLQATGMAPSAIGLTVSVMTGVPLFAPRALAASANPIFQTKMALIAATAALPNPEREIHQMSDILGRLQSTAAQ